MSEQQWRGWDDEQVKIDAEAVEGDDGFFKPKAREESYALRFMPARADEPSAILVVWQHYIEFPDKSKFVFNCPKRMAKQPCAGCNEVERLYDTGSQNDEKLAKRFSPKVRVFSRVIDRDNEAKGPRVFAFGTMIFDDLKALRKNARSGGDFTDPTEKGYDIDMLVTGEGMEREYKIYPGQKGPLASEEQVLEWLDAMPSLSKWGKILSPDAIAAGLRIGAPAAPAPRTIEQPARLSSQAGARTLEGRAPSTPAPRTRRDTDPVF